MSIRILFGTATVDAKVFWDDIATQDGWKIQYNKTLDKASPLKPYRLLDPQGHLWASADNLHEFESELPSLIQELQTRTPLLSSDEAKEMARSAIQVLVIAAVKQVATMLKRG